MGIRIVCIGRTAYSWNRVQPVTGGNIRTLHRNLLLPLEVKLEPDYNSDDSILEEDDSSSDESIVPEDTKTKVCDRKRLVKKTQPHSEENKHVEFDSNVDIFPGSDLQSNLTDSIVEQEIVGKILTQAWKTLVMK